MIRCVNIALADLDASLLVAFTANACAEHEHAQPCQHACRVTGICALLRRRLGGPSDVLVRRAALPCSSPPGMAAGGLPMLMQATVLLA
jgi:hypothetical protein